MLPYLTGTLICVRGYLGSNMGLLRPLQELPRLGLHGKNVVAKKTLFHIVTTYEKLVVNYFFWDFGTLGFGVRPPGLPKPISHPQPHKSIKGINGTPQYIFVHVWEVLGGPFAESKVPKCQRIKTSSQWRHMYNKENDQLFIYGPQYICEKN